MTGKSLASEFAPWMLLTGPALHLWFLPFACASCIALWPLAQSLPLLAPPARGLCSLTFAGLAVAVMLAGPSGGSAPPFDQWLHAAPAVLLGTGIAVLGAGARPVRSSMLLFGGTLGLLGATGWQPGSLQLALGGGALLLCLALPRPGSPMSRRMADLSLTLYLAHPMVIAILLRTTPIPAKSLLMACAAVACTLLLAVLIQRIRLLPPFNGRQPHA